MDANKKLQVTAIHPNEDKAYFTALNRVHAVIEFSLEGTVLHANNNFLNTLGYSLEEIVGKHHRIFCHPEYVRSPEYQNLWEKLGQGRFESGEYKRIGKDGKEIWLQACYNPIFDEEGNPYKIVKFASDITAAKLKAAEYESKVTAINRAQAVIEFNLNGTILSANQNFLDAMGYTLEEVVGKHHRIFCQPEFAKSSEYKEFWERLSSGEFFADEYKRVGRGGKEVWIQASYNPVFDTNGKPFKVIKFATDVSKSKLRNAEFEGKINALGKSQAIIEFNLDGTIISANENFLATLGYKADEVIGRHHRIFCENAYAQSNEYLAFWDKLGRGEFDQGEYKRVGKGGKEVWIQASYNPIFDMNGKPFKVVKFASDVTKTKYSNAEYEGKVKAISRGQAVIEFSMDGTILTANENFLKTLGYSLDEIQSRHHRMFCEETMARSEEYQQFWQKLAKGEFEGGEFKRLAKHGREVWIQATYNPIFDMNGKPFKVVKFATDITATKLKNADFEGKLNGINRAQAVIEFNLDGNVITANQNFLDAVGYTMDEIKGKHHRIFCESAFSRSMEYREFWEALASGEVISGRFKRLSKTGKDVWIQASYNPIYDMNGKVHKVVKFASDVTLQVEKENEIESVIKRLVSNLTKSTESIAKKSSDVSEGTQALGAATVEMSASVEALTNSIESIAQNTRNADSLAKLTQSESEIGAKLIQQSIESMALINRSSEEISEIVKVINEIANQTNLLAFNAAIEAARAGEHGLGFSIVADEVRKLAERSSLATKEISKLISESTKRVANGSQISKEAGDAFQKIISGVSKTTQAISEISVAAQEQHNTAKEVSVAIHQVAEQTEKSASSCESIAQATLELKSGATELSQTINKAAA